MSGYGLMKGALIVYLLLLLLWLTMLSELSGSTLLPKRKTTFASDEIYNKVDFSSIRHYLCSKDENDRTKNISKTVKKTQRPKLNKSYYGNQAMRKIDSS